VSGEANLVVLARLYKARGVVKVVFSLLTIWFIVDPGSSAIEIGGRFGSLPLVLHCVALQLLLSARWRVS
jgi:hypothetical protein